MNKLISLFLLITSLAFSQSQTPLVVYNSAGTATGAIRFQERRSFGSDHVGIKAPDDIPASIVFTLPSIDGTAGQCITTDGALTLTWAACGAGSTPPFADTQTIVKGSVDATKLIRFEVDGLTTATTRVLTPPDADITIAGINLAQTWTATQTMRDILFSADNTYSVAATGTRPSVIYSHNFDGAPGGTTGNYVKTRKADIVDAAGGAGFWDFQVNATAGESSLYIRDNSGSRWVKPYRVDLSSSVNYTHVFSDWLPAKRLIADGDAVDDTDFPSIGSTTRRWLKVWTTDADVNGTLVVTGVTTLNNNLNFSSTAAPAIDGLGSIGSASYRYGNVYTYGLNASGTITFPTGAVNGYVWTSDASGNGSWVASASGTTLPVADTQTIVKGSVDATKLLRFEVDGFTTGTTRVLTPQNNSYTIAGTDIAQTFSAGQTFSSTATFNAQIVPNSTVAGSLIPSSNISYSLGSTSARWLKVWTQDLDLSGGINGVTGVFSSYVNFASGTMSGTLAPGFDGLGSIGSSSAKYSTMYGYTINAYTAYAMNGTTVINSSRNLVGLNNVAQSLTFSASSTYNIGSSTVYPLNIWANYVEPKTSLVMGSGTSVQGDLLPTTSTTYLLGNSTYKWSALYTNNAFFYGSIQAPSGSLGASTTITVRDSAGTGTCTITVSGGLITSTTC